MKYLPSEKGYKNSTVAPRKGVWIEIPAMAEDGSRPVVAPL
ncbi:hypothetical protein CLOSTMETH_01857 [[Clostridium] methylpentosum DSM 5476]|uniref:Uncharacterized protein n=1 Tax=[Clostridium] methylpentosum DSM 5476 TaxID=537013 RepID=C0EDD0_9FIRM|nr:hypothetical protein CLOSTMETH_01857 [[Clostridium] methylpentosum DSM 5476]